MFPIVAMISSSVGDLSRIAPNLPFQGTIVTAVLWDDYIEQASAYALAPATRQQEICWGQMGFNDAEQQQLSKVIHSQQSDNSGTFPSSLMATKFYHEWQARDSAWQRIAKNGHQALDEDFLTVSRCLKKKTQERLLKDVFIATKNASTLNQKSAASNGLSTIFQYFHKFSNWLMGDNPLEIVTEKAVPKDSTAVVSPTALNGRDGFIVEGMNAGDRSSGSISSAGDINGDGLDDILIGAYGASVNDQKRTGKAYVIFGHSQFGQDRVFNLSTLDGSNGFVINGINAEDRLGWSGSEAGDVNGDGLSDFLVSAYRADPNGRDAAGEVYVIFGHLQLGQRGVFDIATLNGMNGFVINGVDILDGSGFSVGHAGDVNGDGFGDILVGAHEADPHSQSAAGKIYVVFGYSQLGEAGILNLSELDGTNGFVINGISKENWSGFSVSTAGDVNGDSLDDILIGAPDPDDINHRGRGKAYVILGHTDLGKNASLELSALNGVNGFVINGISDGDRCGYSVSSAGDINGDGLDDILIGAPAGPNGRDSAGKTYVIFGNAQLGQSGVFDLSTLNGVNGCVINGINPSDRSGFSVSGAGDINGDALGDILIGAPDADPNGPGSGAAYVIFGRTYFEQAINVSTLYDGTHGFVIHGCHLNDRNGAAVSDAGDINGDGLGDLLVGARLADPKGQNEAGETYVFFGKEGKLRSFSSTLSAPPIPIKNTVSSTSSSSNHIKSDLTENLIAYYPFINGSVEDFSGHGHHGLIIGNIIPSVDVNGVHNNALAFDGQSYIKGSSTGFPSSERTISLWFYDGTSGAHNPTLMAYGGNPCGTSFMMSLNNKDHPGTYEVQGHCRVDRVSASYQTYPNYQWHHWVVSSDSTGTRMYLDMQEIANHPVVLGHTNTYGREFSMGVNISPVSGKAPYTDANTDYFIGALDEIRLYDRALSLDEIGHLFQGHLQYNLEGAGLVAHYPFEGNANNSVDEHHSGTVVGAQLVNGPFGQAYQFNGINDYILVPADSALEPFDLTVSFWVKFTCPLNESIELLVDSSHGGNQGWVFQYLHDHYPDRPYVIGFGYAINQDGFTGYQAAEYQQDFCDGGWHHFAGFIDSQSINLQIDGVLRVKNDLVHNGARTPSHRDIHIGSWWRSNTRFLDGVMDEIRIYNRALTEQEATLLYWREYLLQTSSPTPSQLPSPSPSSLRISPSPSKQISLSKGLIAYYPFTDGSTADFSGHNHHGHIVGAIVFPDDFLGKCLGLHGAGYVAIPDSPDFHNVERFSYAFWFNTVDNGAHDNFFMAKHWEFFEAYVGPGVRQIRAIPYRGIYLDTPINAYQLSTWHHLSVVYDSQNFIAKIYLDGKSVLETFHDNDGTFGQPISISSRNLIRIGARQDYTHLLHGKMDDLCIYSRALSQQEVLQLMQSGPFPSQSSSISPSSSMTLSPSSSISATETMSMSHSSTGSTSMTLSSSESPSLSPSSSTRLSATPSGSISVSDSSSISQSESGSITITPSHSQTSSASVSPSDSISTSGTMSTSHSSTGSTSMTPSSSENPSLSPSSSTRLSATPSGSISVSGSASMSQSGSGSITITSSHSTTSRASVSLSDSTSTSKTVSTSHSLTGSTSMTASSSESPSLSPSSSTNLSETPSGSISVSGSASISQSASGSITITSSHSPTSRSSVSLSDSISTSGTVSMSHWSTDSTSMTASSLESLSLFPSSNTRLSATPSGSISVSGSASISQSQLANTTIETSYSEDSINVPSITSTTTSLSQTEDPNQMSLIAPDSKDSSDSNTVIGMGIGLGAVTAALGYCFWKKNNNRDRGHPRNVPHAEGQNPQENFICPITYEVMSDPVITAEGHSYERSAIEAWLENHDTSPITNAVLEHKDLTPNLQLKIIIEDWKRAQSVPTDEALRNLSRHTL